MTDIKRVLILLVVLVTDIIKSLNYFTSLPLQLLDFIQRVNKDGPLSWRVKQSIENVKANIQWRKTNENDVENWLKDFFAKNNIDDGFSEPAK